MYAVRISAYNRFNNEERLWVNPDCGLKTRSWRETRQALANMVKAARNLRGETA
ncbi:hypothetical protein [Pantoea ananatis]|uniref:hypothetical protein n=1 Tax=Pantoea ananas TaxID=553 RepID=UPI0021F6D137|nr:hypothetical protein [Pantoea ananatis]